MHPFWFVLLTGIWKSLWTRRTYFKSQDCFFFFFSLCIPFGCGNPGHKTCWCWVRMTDHHPGRNMFLSSHLKSLGAILEFRQGRHEANPPSPTHWGFTNMKITCLLDTGPVLWRTAEPSAENKDNQPHIASPLQRTLPDQQMQRAYKDCREGE